MFESSSLAEYRIFLIRWVRELERKRAHGDADRLAQIENTTDAYLLRKWLWMASIVGAPVVYLVIPFLLNFWSFLPAILLTILWFLAKGLMGIVFVLFMAAIFFTLRGNFEEMK